MSYSIKALHYATQEVRGPQVFFQSDWDERIIFYYYAFLIEGEGHKALIDCGMDDLGPLNDVILPGLGERGLARLTSRESTIVHLLDREGVALEDIDTVAFTHFHADHISNARLFPRARYLVSREGWKRHHAILDSYPQMVPDPVYPASVIDFLAGLPAERLALADDGKTSLPGIEIKYVGGHTPDSAAFIVPTQEGRVVIPGDTIWTYRNLEEDRPVGSAVDILQCYQAMDWARKSGDVVLPCHDPGVLDRHPDGVVSHK
jgi:glyoxylase-like metal-dependent hydrolase (beta-lactamase superfamily II)